MHWDRIFKFANLKPPFFTKNLQNFDKGISGFKIFRESFWEEKLSLRTLQHTQNRLKVKNQKCTNSCFVFILINQKDFPN